MNQLILSFKKISLQKMTALKIAYSSLSLGERHLFKLYTAQSIIFYHLSSNEVLKEHQCRWRDAVNCVKIVLFLEPSLWTYYNVHWWPSLQFEEQKFFLLQEKELSTSVIRRRRRKKNWKLLMKQQQIRLVIRTHLGRPIKAGIEKLWSEKKVCCSAKLL